MDNQNTIRDTYYAFFVITDSQSTIPDMNFNGSRLSKIAISEFVGPRANDHQRRTPSVHLIAMGAHHIAGKTASTDEKLSVA